MELVLMASIFPMKKHERLWQGVHLLLFIETEEGYFLFETHCGTYLVIVMIDDYFAL
jgi:hypothetical protein